MSRLFVSASSQKLEAAAAVVTAYPFTMAVWVNAVTMSATQTAISVGNSATTANYYALGTLSTAKMFFESANATTNDATGATTLNTGVWNHLAVVAVSAANITVYANGISDGTSTTGRTATGINRTDIGALNSGGVFSSFFNGQIEQGAIWSVGLNSDEIKALAKGVSPLRIRPASRTNYVPISGTLSPEPDSDSTNTFAVTGATQGTTSPPMAYPLKPNITRPALFRPGLAR